MSYVKIVGVQITCERTENLAVWRHKMSSCGPSCGPSGTARAHSPQL